MPVNRLTGDLEAESEAELNVAFPGGERGLKDLLEVRLVDAVA